MKHLSRVFIAICFIILYAPIIVLMLFSFNSTASTGVFAGFSLYWYRELFRSSDVFDALRNTLILAVSSAVTATVIGTCAAVGLDRMRSRRMSGLVSSVTNIPMMNPDIVTGVSMMLLFVFVGTLIGATEDKLNFWTLFIAHVTFNLPCDTQHIAEAEADGPQPSRGGSRSRVHSPSVILQSGASRHYAGCCERSYNGVHAFARRFCHQLFHLRQRFSDSAHTHLLDDKERGKARHLCSFHPYHHNDPCASFTFEFCRQSIRRSRKKEESC